MTAPTIPTTAAELEEMIGDAERMQPLFGDIKAFKEFVTNYSREVTAKDPQIVQQQEEQVQKVLADFLKRNDQDIQRLSTKHVASDRTLARNALYSKTAPGVKADKLYTTTGEFFAKTWHRARTKESADFQGELSDIKNSFGSTVPSDGGFLIPEILRSELLRVSLETAVVRPRARVIPMDSLRVPFPTVDSTSNASSVYGGITAYWTEEAGALVESQAKFGRTVLEAKKLTAYAEVPNELYTDSIVSLDAFINQLFPEALAWFEDVAFMQGSGVGEPLGYQNADCLVNTSKEAGQASGTILWENIVKMYARMLPSSLSRAVWIANINTFPELATMALSVGTGGSAIWLNNGAAGPPMTILGRPVIFTEKAQTLGTSGDIGFVDFGYYLVGDRQAMSAEQSAHYKFGNDKTAIRFIERVDGQPWLQSAITPRNGTTTLSPFVQLENR